MLGIPRQWFTRGFELLVDSKLLYLLGCDLRPGVDQLSSETLLPFRKAESLFQTPGSSGVFEA